MRIFKYAVNVIDDQEIEMPKGAQILTVQVQDGLPWIWVAFTEGMETVKRKIVLMGTGHTRDMPGVYIGTFQLAGGRLIFHLFDGGEA